jgi:hypothetical protein
MALGRRFSQRGLRRTFNDLARAAGVESVVTRSISGHMTEQMQVHYSTVNAVEQERSIGKVIDLMRAQRAGGAPKAESEAVETDVPDPLGALPKKKPAERSALTG